MTDQPPSRRPARARAVGLAVSLALTAALVGLLEVGLRWLGARPGAAPEGEQWLLLSPSLGWEPRPDWSGRLYDTDRSFDPNGRLVPPPDVPRRDRPAPVVLLLGDSRTFGNGVPLGDTWGAQLQRDLPNVAVENLAVPGYSAYQGRVLLERAIAERNPVAVVMSFGFNDRRYVAPEDRDGAARFRRLVRASGARSLRRMLRFGDDPAEPEGARASTSANGPTQHAGAPGDQPLDLESVVPRVAPPAYEEELEAVARITAAAGIRLVLLLVPDNPRDVAALQAAMASAARGDEPAAERQLGEAAATENVFADAARVQLAQLHAQAGRAEEARRVRLSPRSLKSISGGYPLLPEGPYHEAACQVAARHGLPVVDGRQVFRAHPEWYLDFCHFDAAGHRAVAGLVLPRLAGL